MDSSSQNGTHRLRAALALALALVTLLLAAPWRIVDTDALSRLAVGRVIVAEGGVPRTDPLTFSRPEQRWVNPEWLGDIAWYGSYRLGGETGVIAFKLALAATGWVLLFVVALRGGAGPLLVLALMLVALPSGTGRLFARNAIHAQWLIPLYLLVLQRAGRRWHRLWALAPLAVLWANLHSSFVLGWLLVGAAAVDQLLAPMPGTRPRDAWRLGAVLAIHPLLAMLGPHGPHVYAQLWDHLQGGAIYRQLVLEWRPPAEVDPGLRLLPLHLLGIIGLLSFLPRCNRRRAGALLRIAAALALAHNSQRFVALLPVLALPDLAINLQRWLGGRWPDACARPRLALTASLTVLGLLIAVPTIITARDAPALPPVLDRVDAPVAAARFLATQAPPGARLFSPYNSGPFLLWLATPRVRLYLDPRNNLGAEPLYDYINHLLVQPGTFERQARELKIELTMVDLGDGNYHRLAQHLRTAHHWRLIFIDGRFAIYARTQGRTERLVTNRGYRVVQGALDFDQLLGTRTAPPPAELARLEREAPALSDALRAFLLLKQSGGAPPQLPGRVDPRATRKAARLLATALPRLPASAALMSYLATAYARLDDEAAFRDVARAALQLFPNDPHTRALKNAQP